MTALALDATPFVGRRRELVDVRRTLAGARLVTLTGIGGAGKTRLARSYAESEPEGSAVWTVPLADVTESHLVGLAVVEALGLHIRPTDSPVDAVAELVADRPALLVLDNCEQVGDAAAFLVVELLERCPHLRVLTTSRHALGVRGEVVYPVPPLSVPGPDDEVALTDLERYDGVRLFLQRAAAAMPGFRATEANAAAIGRLCGALEGLPLSLELAAARITALTPEVMLERLEDRYRLLSRGYADTPDRQRSLLASVTWSYDLCSPQERLLWARLSVFAGGFGLEAAEYVCSGSGLDAGEVLDVLQNLIDKSLVTRDPADDLHYRMLETIRQFGMGRLAEAGEFEHYRHRHEQWFVDLSMRLGVEWTGPTQAVWLEHWRRNHANLRIVLEHCAGHPEDAPTALRVVMALEGYWLVTGLLAEARHWLELALSHGTGTVPERALAHGMLAYLAAIRGDTDDAAAHLAENDALVAEQPLGLLVAYQAFTRASVAFFAGDMDEALTRAQEALARFEDVGVVNHVSVCLMITGVCHDHRGEREAAERAIEACLETTRAAGELYTRSLALWWRGVAARDAGDLDRAARLQLEALTMKEVLRDRPGLAMVLEALAGIASARGDGERAATLFGAARAIWSFVQGAPASAPFIAAERDVGEALARSLLAERSFERSFRRGQQLGTAEAIRLARGQEPRGGPGPQRLADGVEGLTTREREVAALLGEGLSNQEIADRLVISIRTAQGHVENILRKLGLSSRAQVAARVARGHARS
ncbi:LuxR family transcriptional regulator [Nocardioides sp. HDW12B]|uniref:ATP-binding protein n=1 Tax=Nocardioides sp. HDW12B TaxID=2714939 RepID=UPI0014092336|nr:LuxR C-terminal-related transcriptional regulator [Nocardioides sp. HDW12B]QIK67741.1 LuxR family transcriptional regulator [Nocardioides sp. HDW12B]